MDRDTREQADPTDRPARRRCHRARTFRAFLLEEHGPYGVSERDDPHDLRRRDNRKGNNMQPTRGIGTVNIGLIGVVGVCFVFWTALFEWVLVPAL